MKILFAAFACLALISFQGAPAGAVEPHEILKDPVLEKRARDISAELRCLVCQNQSIDDSDAPLARDLRVLVRDRLTAGDTNRQAVDYIVDRYGEFVLLRPRFGLHTLILWISMPVILLLALFMIYRQQQQRRDWVERDRENTAKLSNEEKKALDDILSES